MTSHKETLRSAVRAATVVDVPPGWRETGFHGVGGLTAVAFGDDDRYLLVISHQGRGVFDCETGERVARDDAEPTPDSGWLDEYGLTAVGIGPLEDQRVRIAGLWGGALARMTRYGWSTERIQMPWPDEILLVHPSHEWIGKPGARLYRLRDPISEVRAFGFSPSGRFLALATGADLTLYSWGAG